MYVSGWGTPQRRWWLEISRVDGKAALFFFFFYNPHVVILSQLTHFVGKRQQWDLGLLHPLQGHDSASLTPGPHLVCAGI